MYDKCLVNILKAFGASELATSQKSVQTLGRFLNTKNNRKCPLDPAVQLHRVSVPKTNKVEPKRPKPPNEKPSESVAVDGVKIFRHEEPSNDKNITQSIHVWYI